MINMSHTRNPSSWRNLLLSVVTLLAFATFSYGQDKTVGVRLWFGSIPTDSPALKVLKDPNVDALNIISTDAEAVESFIQAASANTHITQFSTFTDGNVVQIRDGQHKVGDFIFSHVVFNGAVGSSIGYRLWPPLKGLDERAALDYAFLFPADSDRPKGSGFVRLLKSGDRLLMFAGAAK
jgi:hypothetical protein